MFAGTFGTVAAASSSVETSPAPQDHTIEISVAGHGDTAGGGPGDTGGGPGDTGVMFSPMREETKAELQLDPGPGLQYGHAPATALSSLVIVAVLAVMMHV